MPSRDDHYWSTKLHKTARRMDAANSMFKGCLEQFFAALMVGSDQERAEARNAVLAAHEAVLDAFEEDAWIKLERDGIDPMRRHL